VVRDEARRRRSLTAAEAARALYIDFEGEKDVPPVILGVLRRGRGARPYVHQDLLDPALAALGNPITTLHGAVLKVVQRAERRDCRIVAWSEHELSIAASLGKEDPGLVRRFTDRYANGRAIAERWRTTVHDRVKPVSGQLVHYEPLAGFLRPPDPARGNVGTILRGLRAKLMNGRPLTEGDLERWRQLLEHNRYDCAGMRRVCWVAAREMEARKGEG
jgi:hypothetical protein